MYVMAIFLCKKTRMLILLTYSCYKTLHKVLDYLKFLEYNFLIVRKRGQCKYGFFS
ncbi:Uncharacterised protein [Bacillus cereus]|nr:Uncharacterised protein [Bacillus cereus]